MQQYKTHLLFSGHKFCIYLTQTVGYYRAFIVKHLQEYVLEKCCCLFCLVSLNLSLIILMLNLRLRKVISLCSSWEQLSYIQQLVLVVKFGITGLVKYLSLRQTSFTNYQSNIYHPYQNNMTIAVYQ